MARPRVALVHVGAPEGDLSDSAIRLEDRVIALRRLAPALGVDLDVLTADELLDGAADAGARLAGAQAVWWAGRTARRDEAEALWRAMSAAAPRARLLDPPDHVDEAFDLSRSYPALARVGVPQARTRFYPLAPAVAGLDRERLREALARQLRWLWVRRAGRFFRTFYGTRKLHQGALNVARSKPELLDGVVDMVLALRGAQDVGGVAVRELLELDGFWDEHGRRWISREYRVFVLQGQPVMWLCHADLDQLRRVLSPDDQRRAGALTTAQRDAMLDHARRAGGALRATLVSVDFAVVRGGRLVCVETNPGHCSGWGTPAAYVRVHGEVLRRLAGLPPLSRDDALALARDEGVDLGGLGELFDLL